MENPENGKRWSLGRFTLWRHGVWPEIVPVDLQLVKSPIGPMEPVLRFGHELIVSTWEAGIMLNRSQMENITLNPHRNSDSEFSLDIARGNLEQIMKKVKKILHGYRGLFMKYVLVKTDGAPIEPGAEYFVLRLDTDHDARKAATLYALLVSRRDLQLSTELLKDVQRLEGEQED